MKKIRVMIIEDSDVVRMLLEEIISRDSRLEVAASVANAEEGLRLLNTVAPDVISLDIRLPGMNGFQATKRIMSERPIPIVVVSASVEKEDLKISINALKAGALTIVEKPVGTTRANFQEMADHLCTQLAIMSAVKVIRQRRPLSPTPVVRPSSPQAYQVHKNGAFGVLGIAASTGGPNALEKLLNGLPTDFPMPILLVQHITPSFLEGFASWLDDVCPFAAAVARDGEIPVAGKVYVAPAERHLQVKAGRISLDLSPPVSSQRPSGTVLFESLAREFGSRAIGILLTGMGDDGAKGLSELRAVGGYTIVEDESTAVVYGMPQAAVRLGAACEALPVHDIAARILDLIADSGQEGDRREERNTANHPG
ncbi:MAG: chemotaxis-specific protein-glutamate methyltransferase CheB [Nitrospirae bacterium]|nr:MAG: chemotaxis-specific protein-glutamate methyltransferase CheB [Nitrospirota bacterium]